MKNICIGLFVLAAAAVSISAQTERQKESSRVVLTNSLPPTKPQTSQTPIVVGQSQPSQASNLNYKGLSFSQIKSKIAEAKRDMQTRPIATAITDPTELSAIPSMVRIAYYNWRDKKIDYIVISKDAFLNPNIVTPVISTNGRQSHVSNDPGKRRQHADRYYG